MSIITKQRLGLGLSTLALLLLVMACTSHAPPATTSTPTHAVVEFAIVADAKSPVSESSRKVERNGRSYTLEPVRHFAIQSTHMSQDENGYPAIAFEIADAQRAEFERWTGENVHRTVVILIDGMVVTMATLQSALPGAGIINNSGADQHWTEQQARELAARIAPVS
jgi:preprotein translocase subunit SecD